MQNISKLFIFFLILFILQGNISSSSEEKNQIKILFKVNNNLVTNKDIQNEINYLLAFNDSLKNINENELTEIAKESLFREVIKVEELKKNYNFQTEKKSKYIDKIIKDFYLQLNLQNEKQFEEYLSSKDVELDVLKNKLSIEAIWNEYIFKKYNNLVEINEKEIMEKLEQQIRAKEKIQAFFLNEILFLAEDKKKFETKYNQILKSIEQIGFEATARVLSVSETNKFDGEIGWITKNETSDEIFNIIKNLEIGSISKAINTPGGFLILKVKEKKEMNININKESEFKRIVQKEKNSQLSQFSTIYYKRIKQNSTIYEIK